jgi:putative transposase
MIDREHDLPITKQAEVLRISRGSVYYLPRPVPEADLAICKVSTARKPPKDWCF